MNNLLTTDPSQPISFFSGMNNISFHITLIGLVISMASLIIGFITLRKVKKVEKAQAEERNLVQELLNVDEIESDLSNVIEKLNTIDDSDLKSIAGHLSVRLGSIQGTRNVLNRNAIPTKGDFVQRGFFSKKHIEDSIKESKTKLNIITGSTRIISGYYELELIKKACKRGVKVSIIGMDPEAPEEILKDASLTVSNPPPKDAQDYSNMIGETIKQIKNTVDSWDEQIKQNFQYLVFSGVPRVSFIQCDNKLDIGFLHLFRDVENEDLEQRPYIHFIENCDIGKLACAHLNKKKSQCRILIPE